MAELKPCPFCGGKRRAAAEEARAAADQAAGRKALAVENYPDNRPIPRPAGWNGRNYCRRYTLCLIF